MINEARKIETFASEFITGLENTHKEIYLNFEILNRENFFKNIKNSCKILFLASNISESNSLIFEKEFSKADRLSIPHIINSLKI